MELLIFTFSTAAVGLKSSKSTPRICNKASKLIEVETTSSVLCPLLKYKLMGQQCVAIPYPALGIAYFTSLHACLREISKLASFFLESIQTLPSLELRAVQYKCTPIYDLSATSAPSRTLYLCKSGKMSLTPYCSAAHSISNSIQTSQSDGCSASG